MKTCTDCGVVKDEKEFRANHSFCKKCYQARYNTSERQRATRLKAKYSMTIDEYDQMLESQNGRCAICRTTEPGGSGSRFAVDHNHQTGYVRGLLCSNCNRGIGFLKDSPIILSSALSYLLENDRNSSSSSEAF
jgi:hypothetical protein